MKSESETKRPKSSKKTSAPGQRSSSRFRIIISSNSPVNSFSPIMVFTLSRTRDFPKPPAQSGRNLDAGSCGRPPRPSLNLFSTWFYKGSASAGAWPTPSGLIESPFQRKVAETQRRKEQTWRRDSGGARRSARAVLCLGGIGGQD